MQLTVSPDCNIMSVCEPSANIDRKVKWTIPLPLPFLKILLAHCIDISLLIISYNTEHHWLFCLFLNFCISNVDLWVGSERWKYEIYSESLQPNILEIQLHTHNNNYSFLSRSDLFISCRTPQSLPLTMIPGSAPWWLWGLHCVHCFGTIFSCAWRHSVKGIVCEGVCMCNTCFKSTVSSRQCIFFELLQDSMEFQWVQWVKRIIVITSKTKTKYTQQSVKNWSFVFMVFK